MRNRREHTGYALIGVMIFLLVAMIMWLSVTRQIGTHLRMEKNNQLLQLYNDTTLRALSWGLALMETGEPPSNPYACKMMVGRDESQMFVVEFLGTALLRYTLTARPAVSGDELLPDAPDSFMPLPGQATDPNPPDGAADISTTPVLSWTAGPGTESHDVYFGTISPPTFQGNQTDITFDPGVLLPNTTYYWRIDETNAAGATVGVAWSFTTGTGSAPPPGQAINPDPPDGAADISLAPMLSWTAGSDAESHDVYFGTSSSPAFQGNQTDTTFNPGALLPDTTYYWRIDEVNASGTTTGVLWSFTTGSTPLPLPGQATNPNPADGATNVSRSIIVGWLAGSDASSHDVYFGTSNPPTFQGNQTGTTFDPGPLGRRVWYYWRIDEVNASGTTTGVVWSFRTGNGSTPPPGQATNPNPSNGAAGISQMPLLSWAAGSDTDSHDVYFGTSSSPAFQGNQTDTAFNPGALSPDTTYYWRIDEIGAGGTTTGILWSFTTGTGSTPPPGQATNPNPADGTTNVSRSIIVGWLAGSDAESHNVYFGTTNPPTFQGNQTGTTFDPGPLGRRVWYYWRIDEVNGGGTTTGVVWSFRTGNGSTPPPGQAANPNPSDGATDISQTPMLSWTAGSDTDSHDVYFGTSSSPAFQGNQTGTTFNPGTLSPDTTYYWHIDEVGAGGTTTGILWSFTTRTSYIPPPGQATNPNPADGTTNVSRSIIVSWLAGSGADSHDVYFGTSNPPTFQGNQTGTTFDPGYLGRRVWYYWRIDEVNASGTTTGVVWSFRTGTGSTPPPGQATNPDPPNGAAGISLAPLLSWTAGSDTDSHDVYFGTSSSPVFQGNQTGTAFNPGTLSPDTTYYWRIDEVGAGGTTTGVLWSFTTGSASLPPPGQATNPNPADGTTNVSRSIIVSWLAGSDAVSHDVYFGTTNPPTFQGNQTGTTFDPGYLGRRRWYYWRIDEVNASGTTTGVVWSFRTGNN